MIKKTSKILIFGLLISMLLFSGCLPHSHAFDFNTTSTSMCAYECEELMKEYHCWEASPSYNSQYVNNEQTKGTCSCYIRSCRE